jgi:hypothetical protein
MGEDQNNTESSTEAPGTGEHAEKDISFTDRFYAKRQAIREKAQSVVHAVNTTGSGSEQGEVTDLLSQLDSLDTRTAELLGVEKPAVSIEDSPHSLDSAYRQLQVGERREANPKDVIEVRLKPDSAEYQHLLQQGITADQIDSGKLRREQLLNAGYVFMNKIGIGGQEKGIMSGAFSDPEDPSQTIDFTSRTMLTRDELDKAYRYQLQHPDIYGLQGEDLDEVRKDMLSFAKKASNDEKIPGLDGIIEYGDPLTGSSEDAALVAEYWQQQIHQFMQEHKGVSEDEAAREVRRVFADTYCADLFDMRKDPYKQKPQRGHELKAISLRQQALQGQPSPFLDRGFVYSVNPDVEVFGMHDPMNPDKNTNYRLNMGAIHIFGGHPKYPGLSEMGTADHDQTYMPLGVYVSELYPREAEARRATHLQEASAFAPADTESIIVETQDRVIAAARAWKDGRTDGQYSVEAQRHRLANMKRLDWEDAVNYKPTGTVDNKPAGKVAELAAEGNALAKKAKGTYNRKLQ